MHVVKKAKQLEQSANIEASSNTEHTTVSSNSLNDFIVRWCTCFLMLESFYAMKLIVDEITCNPQLISGIKKTQETKLKKLVLSSKDWQMINSLKKVLYPFYRATVLLQGRKYETLAMSKVSI